MATRSTFTGSASGFWTRSRQSRGARQGVVFGFRHHVDVFAKRGLSVRQIFAADGGAASDLWLQIAADVLQQPVIRIDQHPGSSLGAAFIAGMASGLLQDWADIGRYVAQGRRFLPDPQAGIALDRKYRLWRELMTGSRRCFLALA